MTMTTGLKGDEPKFPDAWQSIEAKPLRTLDIIEHVKPRNPALELYWGNFGIKGGLRYSQLCFAGFVAAKPEELCLRDGSPVPHNIPGELVKEGKVMYGDLIAMLISKEKYQSALKFNALKAIDRGDRLRLKDEVAPQVKGRILERVPKDARSELGRKISTFVPTEADVDRISEANQKEAK